MKRAHLTPSATLLPLSLRRGGWGVRCLALVLFASCTAINQKDAYLDSLPRVTPPVSNVVFTDDFENGLGQWTQVSGNWTTGAPAINGIALTSPGGTTATPYNLTTTNDIDLRGRSNCELKYDVRFDLSATSGVGAQILYAGNVVGEFKNTSGTAAISSSSQFLARRVPLTAETTGKLTVLIQIPSGTADLRIDNIRVTCANPPPTNLDVLYENFVGSAASWSLQTPWAWTSSGGASSSPAILFPTGTTTGSGNSGNWVATFSPAVNLASRYGCRLAFYYAATVTSSQNCLYLEFNTNRIWSVCNVTSAVGNVSIPLTPFEGVATNTLAFRCFDGNSSGGAGVNCLIDEIRLICQQ